MDLTKIVLHHEENDIDDAFNIKEERGEELRNWMSKACNNKTMTKDVEAIICAEGLSDNERLQCLMQLGLAWGRTMQQLQFPFSGLLESLTKPD